MRLLEVILINNRIYHSDFYFPSDFTHARVDERATTHWITVAHVLKKNRKTEKEKREHQTHFSVFFLLFDKTRHGQEKGKGKCARAPSPAVPLCILLSVPVPVGMTVAFLHAPLHTTQL